MRYVLKAILLLFVFSCSTSREIKNKTTYSEFKIVNTPLVVNSDTIFINELQFHGVESSLDAIKLMYLNYGKWDDKVPGKHQENINRIVWENIKLLPHSNETFTVIADGTETITDYFACLIVFDSKEEDCFKANYPLKKELTNLFVNKMNNIEKRPSVYKLFR